MIEELRPFELICPNILLQQFVIATPLKPHNRISWNFVDNKDIIHVHVCRCAYQQEIIIYYDRGVPPLWTYLPKYTTEQFVIATPLKPHNRISWNFVDNKDILCRCAYWQEIMIQVFSRSYFICLVTMLGMGYTSALSKVL